MSRLFLLLLIGNVSVVFSQDDSIKILSYQNYIAIVVNEHPYAKQADLNIAKGEANLLYSKGAFDPKIYTDISQKYFNGSQYYSRINGGLKIPTWFGIELKAGFEENGGKYLNPENTTPNSGLIYGGVSVPIGQGLLIDKRRAELKKAHLFKEVSEMEKRIIINDLIFSAGISYWKWFKSYNAQMVYKDGYRLAQERFEAVKASAIIGNKPFIDTLEAGIQVQNRLLNLKQAELDFKNASALLSIFLWEEGIIPLEIAEGTTPELTTNIMAVGSNKAFLSTMDSLLTNHPQLNQSQLTINQLEIDKRLKKNMLLPVVNLKYNPLTEYLGDETFSNYSINNYTWGVEFQMPIFLRKERGALNIAALKIQEYSLELSNKQALLRYKVMAALNQWETTKEQADIYAKTVNDSQKLLLGEKKLFNAGESSLFMVNSRELGYIKTQIKYIELLTINKKAELSTNYALGVLE